MFLNEEVKRVVARRVCGLVCDQPCPEHAWVASTAAGSGGVTDTRSPESAAVGTTAGK